jgi:4-amino-4-deoxy-L-arabinose transferase-like glycosyltransferase
MRLAMRRVPAPVVLALAGLAVLLRAGVAANRMIDPDESQHLHVAWRVAQGQVPYRDFWEHHLPLFHYLVAPLTTALADRPEIYFAARGLMVLATAGVVLVTWRLARRLSTGTGAWAVAVLLALPQFAETATEARPDVPALLAHLLGLLALVRWREGGPGRWLWAAGAWEGLAVALSLKAVFGLLGVAAALAAPGPARRRAVPALLRLGAGAALAPAAVLGWLAWSGGLPAVRGLARDVVQGSVGFVDRAKAWPVYGSEIGAFVVAGLGLALAWRARGRGLLGHPVHGALLVPALVVAVALALPWTPAVYQHAWLPVLPVAAVYAGLGLAALVAEARRRPAPGRVALAAAALLGAVLVPGAEAVVFALRNQNADQLRQMRAALALACPGEPVLDGVALTVFRPAAHRYGTLVTGVREWVAQGMISEETLAADMRAARARVALPDRRLRAMIGPVAAFLRDHYVAHPAGVLVAGAEIAATPGGGRRYVDLLVGGPHLLTASSGTEVAIDTAAVRPGWVSLAAGPHEVTWRGAGGAIRLVAAACPERRVLGPAPGGGGPGPSAGPGAILGRGRRPPPGKRLRIPPRPAAGAARAAGPGEKRRGRGWRRLCLTPGGAGV